MKIDSKFKIREIAGETIVVQQGVHNADLTRIISLNTSARLLWERLAGRDFTIADAAEVLVSAYGIPEKQASADAAAWLESLKRCGLLE